LLRGVNQTAEVLRAELTMNRRLRDLRALAARLKKSRISSLRACQDILANRLADSKVLEFFSGLPEEEKHYWVSSLYACLMPRLRRRKLAAYFTPPYLAEYAIQALVRAGIKPGLHTILDPASGGAAFLVPLAAQIADDARRHRVNADNAIGKIEKTLAGIEVDADLATLSADLLCDHLHEEVARAGRKPKLKITNADTLNLSLKCPLFDAVIGNPPYGRIFRPSEALRAEFKSVITDGYVNLYSLFLERALKWVRPGGIVCLIVPMSFVGGPHFSALRKHILNAAHVISLDPIDKRNDVFLDVLYDVCVLVLKKKSGTYEFVKPTSSLLLMDESPRRLGHLDIPSFPSERVWALPEYGSNAKLFEKGLETLEDYGYITKTGYFVWNREKDRYRTGYKPRRTEVPLYWAHNVRANGVCAPRDGKSDSNKIGFVKIARDNSAIVRSDAIVLQRTSNRRQKRRLIAAIIRRNEVPGQNGFVSENHTILILPAPGKKQAVSLETLCRLLNTEAVDARFRRISGTVSVSTKALRTLPLPAAQEIQKAIKGLSSDDEAARQAYAQSVKSKDPTTSQNGRIGGRHGRAQRGRSG
jgi:adenine-specific DNA-methyltransferase